MLIRHVNREWSPVYVSFVLSVLVGIGILTIVKAKKGWSRMSEISLTNLAATAAFGEKIGRAVVPGDCLVLTGELGTGKTTLTKGIAKGLDIDALIKSPTYTIVREYPQGRLPLYHMDVYRLAEGDGAELGLDEYFSGNGVSIIEWGQVLGEDLPTSYLELSLFYGTELDQRQLQLNAVGPQGEALLAKLNL